MGWHMQYTNTLALHTTNVLLKLFQNVSIERFLKHCRYLKCAIKPVSNSEKKNRQGACSDYCPIKNRPGFNLH